MEKYVKVKSKTDNYIYVNVATADAVGMIKPDNDTLKVSEDGTLRVERSPYAEHADHATNAAQAEEAYHATNADNAMKATYYKTSSGTPSSKTINKEFSDIKKNIDDIESGAIAVEVAKYYEKFDGGKSEWTIGEHLKDHEDGIDALFATTADLTNNKQDQIKSSDNRNISITLIDELTSTTDGKPDIPSVYGIKKYILDNLKLVKVGETDDIKYQLKIQDNVLGTIDFPKEMLLKTVSYDPNSNILILVFDTENGEITQNIDLNDLVDIYTAGNGLLLVGNQFSINLDGNSNNSLTVSADGLMLDKTQFASASDFQNLSEQVTDNTAQIETLNSNYVKSPVETSAFINGQNTLANAQSTFSVESNNRFDYDSITPKMDYGSFSKIQGGYFVQGADGGRFDVSFSNGWLVFNMSLSKGDIISFDYEVLSLMKPEWNKFTVTINPMNISKNEYGLSVGSSGRFIWEIPKDGVNDWVFRVGGLGVNITNICISKVTDTYTPFLADGTAVTVRKANKNLAYFNNQTAHKLSVSDNIFTANGTATINSAIPAQFVYVTAGTYTLGYKYISGTVEAVEGTSGDIGYIRIYNKDGTALTSKVIYIRPNNYTTEMSSTITITENCFARLYPLVANDKIYTNYKFVCSLEKSDTYTGYEKPVYEDITTAVGQSINITQYDNITNLSVLTEGAVASGQFILSTADQINVKPTSLVGTFAKRPTGTYTYPIIYTATDKTDQTRTTRLEAREDGSVSSKWISMLNSNDSLKLYRHHITMTYTLEGQSSPDILEFMLISTNSSLMSANKTDGYIGYEGCIVGYEGAITNTYGGLDFGNIIGVVATTATANYGNPYRFNTLVYVPWDDASVKWYKLPIKSSDSVFSFTDTVTEI